MLGKIRSFAEMPVVFSFGRDSYYNMTVKLINDFFKRIIIL